MAKSVQWTPGITLPHDPDAIELYTLDLTAWLDGETLDSAEALAPELTAEVVSTTPKTVLVRVSGGSAALNNKTPVTVRATSSAGRVNDWTVNFKVKQQ